MMKRTAMMAMTGLWLCAVVAPQAQEAPKTAPATHVTKEQIQEFIAKLPRGRISDSPIRAIDVGGYRVGVFAVVRPKDSPQDAIYHDTNMTEILVHPGGIGDAHHGRHDSGRSSASAARRQLHRHQD